MATVDINKVEDSFTQSAEAYLQKHQIFDIFSSLSQKLVINKPKNALEFMIKDLERDLTEYVFIISPNCYDYKEIVERLERDHEYEMISIADKEDDAVKHQEEMKKKIPEIKANESSLMLVNGPRTLKECYLLRENKIVPTKVLFIHDKISNQILYYRNSMGADLKYAELLAKEEYKNLNQVIDFYKGCCFQFDRLDLKSHDIISRIFTYKSINASPRRGQKIFFFGAPNSGRKGITSRIAKMYNMTFVSTSGLIKDYINNQSDRQAAEALKDDLSNETLINDDEMNKLIESRLERIDCRSLGFCIEGYPRTEKQYNFLRDTMKVDPDIVIVLNSSDDAILKRFNSSRYDPNTGRTYSLEELSQLKDSSIQNRLKILPVTELEIDVKMKNWEKLAVELRYYFSDKIVNVNTEVDFDTIIQKINFILQKGTV